MGHNETPDEAQVPAAPFSKEVSAYDRVEAVIQPSWKGRIWDTFDLPAPERKLLFKVDAVILTFASVCVGFLSLHTAPPDVSGNRNTVLVRADAPSWGTSSRISTSRTSTTPF